MATIKENPAAAATDNEPATVASIVVPGGIPPEEYKVLADFFERVGVYQTFKPEHNVKDSFSNLVGGILKVVSIQRGKISCLLNVKAPTLNGYDGMHGGAVASVAERVAVACARTVVGKDKHIFLGELSNSYLSSAPWNAAVVVDGSVVRSGRNITLVTVDFRLKETGKVAYMSRATFYNMPISGL